MCGLDFIQKDDTASEKQRRIKVCVSLCESMVCAKQQIVSAYLSCWFTARGKHLHIKYPGRKRRCGCPPCITSDQLFCYSKAQEDL